MHDFQKSTIKFPLYKNDGKPLYIFRKNIKDAVTRVNQKIKSGKYNHVLNSCLCGNEHPEHDLLLAEKDMWGIPVDSLICSKCGLVRSKTIPDNNALADFYETDYKNIYYDSIEPGPYLFNSQRLRGQQFYDIIEEIKLLDKIQTVFDYGCGMGGALMPFYENSKQVSGCDYGEEYLNYGRMQGLKDIYHGEIDLSKTPKNSQDLVMVSHVMEHFTDTKKSMQEIIEIVSPGKYLLVEVPGVFANAPYNYYPIWHLQKGHIFNFFYQDFLIVFFSILGLEIIKGTERCTFILRKPENYSRKILERKFYDDSLRGYPNKVKQHFIISYNKFDKYKWKNPTRIARQILKMADMLRMRNVLGKIIKSSKDWTL